jgi:glycosyltransferase involved in cell wall biosynthesis
LSKTKITYILSNIDKAIAFEWITDKINKQQFELSFIIYHSSESYLYNWLKEKEIECYFIPHYGKKSYLTTFFKTLQLLKKIKPSVVHSHLFDANLIGLAAAKILRIKKRIYTRHHSTYHHQYFPKAVKWDKLANKMATDIIAISKNVESVLVEKENVPTIKITLIHHGFDLIKFDKISQEEINSLRLKYNLTPNNTPIIGVISRYIKWKGVQFIIPAFKKLLIEYPNAKLILANATGPNKTFIKSILQKELAPNQYIEIPFEPNLFALYQLFDIYVHTPIDNHVEAFGQTYVEALASGIPSVFTVSGIANEFIIDKNNALIVDYKNSEEIYRAITNVLNDKELTNSLIENGKKSVTQFNLNLFIQKLEALYE